LKKNFRRIFSDNFIKLRKIKKDSFIYLRKKYYLFSLFVPAGWLPLLVLIKFISYLARNVSLGLFN
jgi:F0F1-type ATP synthase membrane subunit a